jgi:hypothetical protein
MGAHSSTGVASASAQVEVGAVDVVSLALAASGVAVEAESAGV